MSESISRELTKESGVLLGSTMRKIVEELLKASCPCHYPRFRELASFDHHKCDAGPVLCADTNYLTDTATSKDVSFLEEIDQIKENPIGDYESDTIYRCTRCSTRYRRVDHQYSISFMFQYLMIEEPAYAEDVGAQVVKPMPILQGLYGFDQGEIQKCAVDFRMAEPDEVFGYYSERM